MRKIRRNLVSGRKIRDRVSAVSVGGPIDISKMHGHMSLILTDVKTGKKEVIEEDNMMTNALQEHFKNLGFLNFPNVNQSNMVEELLGGVLGLDSEIAENAAIVHVPAGVKMTFNGSVGRLNNSAPTELGSYSADESGWQDDGSYVQTYDFSTSQANGTINCVCLTGKGYGFCGEGNSLSQVAHGTGGVVGLYGNVTVYSGIPGRVFNVNLSDSSCYSFNVENVEEEVEGETVTIKKGFVRKYRLPISKVNIKGTVVAPVKLSETSFSLDSEYLTYGDKLFEPTADGKLLIWNVQQSTTLEWGVDWPQYLWTVTTSGISRTTISNTSGVSGLYGLQAAHFDGNYCFFLNAYRTKIDTYHIYVLNRTTGAISIINNTNGKEEFTLNNNWYNTSPGNFSWNLVHGTGTGRIIVAGYSVLNVTDHTGGSFMIDATLGVVYPTNQGASFENFNPVSGLVRIVDQKLYAGQIRLVRDASYIATINNLDNPVVKTSDKTMKVVYRITFDEQ